MAADRTGGGPGGNQQFQRALNRFLADEGVAVVVRIGGGRSEGGTVFAQAGGSRDPKDPVPPPMVALTPEHYNRIARLLDHKIPVKLEFDIEARFLDDRTDSVNVIGEIEGGRKRQEVVMIGAHLDSWHGGTGATDNAAGSAVMIEVMRILKTLNLRLDRTVRLALVGRRRAGPSRVARLRDRALRGARGHEAQAGARAGSRATSTWTTAPARFAASTCRATTRCGRSSRRG